ncbi:MAG: D-alanine--D-alanine ligase [Polyangiaceae bacterium]
MSHALSIAVIQGGPSVEAEVSRSSAKSVRQALAEGGHRVATLELDRFLSESLRSGGFDVAFPVTHGAVGEDGSLQGLLEVIEIPYVGSGVLASAMAMDKGVARIQFAHAGLPVAKGKVFTKGAHEDLPAVVLRDLGHSVVVKPAASGSALGVTRLPQAKAETLGAALENAFRTSGAVLVEQFVTGSEVTCGVFEHDGKVVAFSPTEIEAPYDAFYTYEARYAAGRSVHHCPARFSSAVLEEVQRIAVGAHRALGCRDLCRADFVVDGASGNVVLLEVNTLPGFTATSLYPEAAQVYGMTFPDLCDRLARGAYRRGIGMRHVGVPLPAPHSS